MSTFDSKKRLETTTLGHDIRNRVSLLPGERPPSVIRGADGSLGVQ